MRYIVFLNPQSLALGTFRSLISPTSQDEQFLFEFAFREGLRVIDLLHGQPWHRFDSQSYECALSLRTMLPNSEPPVSLTHAASRMLGAFDSLEEPFVWTKNRREHTVGCPVSQNSSLFREVIEPLVPHFVQVLDLRSAIFQRIKELSS